jgi:uncharacterized membrane protein YbaN (DUF454 family)
MTEGEEARAGRFTKARRTGFAALGWVMLALGLVGAFVPLMPTTIFLILAAWCFGRSSPRLEAWMLDHPRFGPVLRQWRAHGAVPRRAKLLAAIGMATGYCVFLLTAEPNIWLAIAVACALLGAAAYVLSRPEPARQSTTVD